MRILSLSILIFVSADIYAQSLEGKKPFQFSVPSDTLANSILLDEVTVMGFSDYKNDSLNFRKAFAKAFNYKAPSFKDIFITKSFNSNYPTPYYKATSSTASIISVDVLSFIGLLGKKKAPLSKLQQTVLKKESADYIDRVFSKQKVQKLTGLKNDSLLNFMQQYQPTIQEVEKMTDYDLLMYIKKSYVEYSQPNSGKSN